MEIKQNKSKDKILPFEDSFESHIGFKKYFKQELNIGINPKTITRKSGKAINFKCDECNHMFINSPHGLRGCKFCENQELCKDNSCKICFEKSLASKHFNSFDIYNSIHTIFNKLPEISKEDENKLLLAFNKDINRFDITNNEISNPRYIFKSSTKEIYFICRKCNHNFSNRPVHIDKIKDCPYCSPKNAKMLCPKNLNCDKCFKKSFASHPKSKCWDNNEGKNEGKTPHDVFLCGQYYADFICDECEHSFSAKCNNVSTGYWCPYCAGQKRCEDIDCLMCSARKLSSHPMSFYWNNEKNPKNILPKDISLTNKDKYWFDCPSDKKHPSFEMDAHHISRGQSCPLCVRKTESKFGGFLNSNEPFEKEFTPIWLRNGIKNSFPRFDFKLQKYLIIIEIDGLQHFETRGKWVIQLLDKILIF